jgi:hypothetical protein
LLATTLFLAVVSAEVEPAILVFGTGWGAEGTQASIEANVMALDRTLTVDRVLIGGGAETRSVQVSAPVDETSELLGLVLDRSDGLHVGYRKPILVKAGPATKDEVLKVLGELLASGRPVVVFGAGHGKGSDDDGPASLELWGPDDRLSVEALDTAIDHAHPKAALAMVLGQCHSGAFTQLAHAGEDPPRCVFAAVPGDRPSAGCTADLSDPSARAYLDTIANAFSERRGDRDGDGKVSLVEAHAFAILNDTTIDVPIKSSDDWLEAKVKKIVLDVSSLAKASPLEKIVLDEGLPPEWKKRPPKAIEAELTRLEKEEARLDESTRHHQDESDAVRVRVADRLLERFPELTNPYHPGSRKLLAGDAAEVRASLARDPELESLKAKVAAVGIAEADALEVSRARAKMERWVRSARHIARRAKLSPGDRRALEKLYGCESIVP